MKAFLKTIPKGRVWARGRRVPAETTLSCRPGPPTGRVFKQALNARVIASVVIFVCGLAGAVEAEILFSGERKLNNLVSVLLEVSSISKPSKSFTFTRSSDGWLFISSTCKGTASVVLDKESVAVIVHDAQSGPRREAMRFVAKGE